MSHNDKEDNFPISTTLEGKRKAEEEASITQKPSKKKPAEKETITHRKEGGTVEVNQRTVTIKQRTPNYAVGEDIALCTAYVNCTLNPLVGNDQKAEIFWNAVLQAYNDINSNYSTDDDVIVVERESSSLRNRFQRSIAKQTKEWNPFYKRIAQAPPSGTTKENRIVMASEECNIQYGR
jgi:hypothetical protein